MPVMSIVLKRWTISPSILTFTSGGTLYLAELEIDPGVVLSYQSMIVGPSSDVAADWLNNPRDWLGTFLIIGPSQDVNVLTPKLGPATETYADLAAFAIDAPQMAALVQFNTFIIP